MSHRNTGCRRTFITIPRIYTGIVASLVLKFAIFKYKQLFNWLTALCVNGLLLYSLFILHIIDGILCTSVTRLSTLQSSPIKTTYLSMLPYSEAVWKGFQVELYMTWRGKSRPLKPNENLLWLNDTLFISRPPLVLHLWTGKSVRFSGAWVIIHWNPFYRWLYNINTMTVSGSGLHNVKKLVRNFAYK